MARPSASSPSASTRRRAPRSEAALRRCSRASATPAPARWGRWRSGSASRRGRVSGPSSPSPASLGTSTQSSPEHEAAGRREPASSLPCAGRCPGRRRVIDGVEEPRAPNLVVTRLAPTRRLCRMSDARPRGDPGRDHAVKKG